MAHHTLTAMRAAHLATTMIALTAGRAAGQTRPTGNAYVDSAAVARAAYGTATTALRANDLPGARKAVARAVAAWPTQEAYPWAAAVLATMASDTAGIAAALLQYAQAGFGKMVSADKRFAVFSKAPAVAVGIAQVEANAAPLARSTVRAELADSTFWPEGMDYDPQSHRFYVASIRHRTIAEVDESGAQLRELIPRNRAGVGAILGVRVDAARGVVWATTAGLPQMAGYTAADSSIAALLRIRLSDGSIERRWDLAPSPNGHTLGDLAIGPNGDVFVSDSRDPVLYRLRPGADTLERFTHTLFRSLQGVAPTPDGRAAYVADWSHGLLRLDLATGAVTRLADAPFSSSLGCDGIVLDRGAIIAVQNGSVPRRVMRFVLDPTGTRIVRAEVIDRNTARADEPTIGAIAGNQFVYIANSQWDKYDDNGARIPGTTLARPLLLAVPLNR